MHTQWYKIFCSINHLLVLIRWRIIPSNQNMWFQSVHVNSKYSLIHFDILHRCFVVFTNKSCSKSKYCLEPFGLVRLLFGACNNPRRVFELGLGACYLENRCKISWCTWQAERITPLRGEQSIALACKFMNTHTSDIQFLQYSWIVHTNSQQLSFDPTSIQPEEDSLVYWKACACSRYIYFR